jgi:hypothetical protein
VDFWGVDFDGADCGDDRGVCHGFRYSCPTVEWLNYLTEMPGLCYLERQGRGREFGDDLCRNVFWRVGCGWRWDWNTMGRVESRRKRGIDWRYIVYGYTLIFGHCIEEIQYTIDLYINGIELGWIILRLNCIIWSCPLLPCCCIARKNIWGCCVQEHGIPGFI